MQLSPEEYFVSCFTLLLSMGSYSVPTRLSPCGALLRTTAKCEDMACRPSRSLAKRRPLCSLGVSLVYVEHGRTQHVAATVPLSPVRPFLLPGIVKTAAHPFSTSSRVLEIKGGIRYLTLPSNAYAVRCDDRTSTGWEGRWLQQIIYLFAVQRRRPSRKCDVVLPIRSLPLGKCWVTGLFTYVARCPILHRIELLGTL